MTLTAEIVNKLRQPFALEHIRWKIQTNPKEGDAQAVVVVFVDARTVAAHLDDVVPGQWTTAYHLPPVTVGHPALECRLTVCDVTRCDVGTVEPSKSPDSDTKDLYSDALKRAAVQFGIGSFLYRFPQVKASVKQFGRSYYLTREAEAELKALTEAVIRGDDRLPRFQHITVRGYNPDGVSAVTGAGEDAPAPAPERPQKAEQPAPRPSGAPAPQKAPSGPTISAGQAQTLHKRLGAILAGTPWQGKDKEFAGRVLGFPVSSFTDLTVGEAQQVQTAAEQEPKPDAA